MSNCSKSIEIGLRFGFAVKFCTFASNKNAVHCGMTIFNSNRFLSFSQHQEGWQLCGTESDQKCSTLHGDGRR